MINLKYIVTGCGRSGTVFTAKLLTKLGIPCGHECIFDYQSFDKIALKLFNPQMRELSYCSTHDLTNLEDSPEEIEKWVESSETIAESSYMAAPYLHLPELNDVKIIHIVRNPIKVISSFVKSLNYFKEKKPSNEWEVKIYSVLTDLKNIPTQIERACFYYCKWNELIEKNKHKQYFLSKIENIENNQAFFDFIQKNKQEICLSKQTNVINKREKDLKVTDIPSGEVKLDFIKKCGEYNYI